MGTVRVLVVDDDRAFNRVFLKHFGIGEAMEAITIDEGVHLAGVLGPDYVFLDVRFDNPWKTGIDAIPAFKNAAPAAKLIVMSSLPNEYDRRRALELGAYNYCIKTELVRANGVVLSLQAPRATRPLVHQRPSKIRSLAAKKA